jgi:aromatic-L-amino-acid decarboxylase
MNSSEKFPKQFSDMSSEEFKKLGYATIDWIASYLENIEKYPVLPDIKY